MVLKDVPIGAWTVAMFFDVFDLIDGSRKFALAAEASIAIGILGAAGAASTGLTDWSDVDPPARKMGLLHGVLNIGATALFTTSLLMRRKKARAGGRVAAALGYALMMVCLYCLFVTDSAFLLWQRRARTSVARFQKASWLTEALNAPITLRAFR